MLNYLSQGVYKEASTGVLASRATKETCYRAGARFYEACSSAPHACNSAATAYSGTTAKMNIDDNGTIHILM